MRHHVMRCMADPRGAARWRGILMWYANPIQNVLLVDINLSIGGCQSEDEKLKNVLL